MTTETMFFVNIVITLFVATLVWFLAFFHRRTLFATVVLVTLYAFYVFLRPAEQATFDPMGFTKFLAEVPLGLGSILLFSFLSKSQQSKYIALFAFYVNAAVIGNIAMMIFVPSEGTWRGELSRVLCLILVFWLIQEMRKVKGKTTLYSDGIFLFNSSPLPWILCHSCYRMALVSLPAFDSLNYILLEVISLSMMTAFYIVHRKGYPINYYFGFADTLTVCTLVSCSHFFHLSLPDLPFLSAELVTQSVLDLIFVPIQTITFCIALRFIWRNHQSTSATRV